MNKTTALTSVALGTMAAFGFLLFMGAALPAVLGMLFVGLLFFILIGATTV